MKKKLTLFPLNKAIDFVQIDQAQVSLQVSLGEPHGVPERTCCDVKLKFLSINAFSFTIMKSIPSVIKPPSVCYSGRLTTRREEEFF